MKCGGTRIHWEKGDEGRRILKDRQSERVGRLRQKEKCNRTSYCCWSWRRQTRWGELLRNDGGEAKGKE